MNNEKPTRRDFLKTSAAGIAAITLVSQFDKNEKIFAETIELNEKPFQNCKIK